MAKKGNFIIAKLDGRAWMWEEDDPRLENTAYEVEKGKFVKERSDERLQDGTRLLGKFVGEQENYLVFTSRKAKTAY